jgi:hypothetical protein
MKLTKTNWLKFKINKINTKEIILKYAKIFIWIKYFYKRININKINLSQQYHALN